MMCDAQMTGRETGISRLIEMLENILSQLDHNGHRISAIKVEEAISALKEDQQKLAASGDNIN